MGDLQRSGGCQGVVDRPVQAVDQVHHRPLLDHHAFRTAGRSGGEQDIGEPVAPVDPGRAVGPWGDGRADQGGVCKPRRIPGLGREHQPAAGIGDHGAQPVGGVSRVERHIGAARLQDAEHRRDQRNRSAGQRQPDRLFGPQTVVQQSRRPAVGRMVQRPVVDTTVVADHRRPRRGAVGLGLEQGRQAGGAIDRGPVEREVPGDLLGLRRRHQGQMGDGLGPVGRRRAHQGRQMAGHPGDAGVAEQVGIVGQFQRQGLAKVLEPEGQIELCRDLGQGHCDGPQSIQDKRPLRLRQGDHDVEERRSRRIPVGADGGDHVLERCRLMRQRVCERGRHPVEQGVEGVVGVEVIAQHDGVGEEPDGPIQARMPTPRHRCAHANVALSGISVK